MKSVIRPSLALLAKDTIPLVRNGRFAPRVEGARGRLDGAHGLPETPSKSKMQSKIWLSNVQIYLFNYDKFSLSFVQLYRSSTIVWSINFCSIGPLFNQTCSIVLFSWSLFGRPTTDRPPPPPPHPKLDHCMRLHWAFVGRARCRFEPKNGWVKTISSNIMVARWR